MGYAKLWDSILMSSVWNQPDTTRIVWITLMALSNSAGFVRGNVTSLARAAVVSIDDCQKALDTFRSPDPESGNKANEGRRLSDVDDGWVLLNFADYRNRVSDNPEHISNRKRQKKFRALHNVTKRYPASASAYASASASSSVSLEDSGVGEGKPGEPPPVLSYSEKPFDKWTKEDLEASVKDSNEDKLLTDDEAVDFVSYWTQKTARGKYLFWTEKTWDTRRRMNNALKLIYEKHRKAPQDAPGYDKWAPENLKDDPLLGEKNPWEMKK